MTWDSVIKINSKLEGQVEIAVLGTRAIPMFPISVVSAAAGVMRMNAVSFVLWSFLGAVLRYMMLGYLGWLTKGGYDQPSAGSHWSRWAAGAGLLIVVGAFFFWKRRKRA